METTKTKPDVKTEQKKTAAEAKERVDAEKDQAATESSKVFDKKIEGEDEHTAYNEPAEEGAEAKAEDKSGEAEKPPKKEDETSETTDEDLLARAEQVGISPEKAEAFSSKKDLEAAVELLEEAMPEEEKPEETEEEKKARETVEAKIKDDEAPYDCKLDPSTYDEGVIKGLNELGTMLKKRVVALEKTHSDHARVLNNDRVMKHTDWFDSKVNRLPEDLKKTYGEGEIDDLEPESEQFKARARLDTKIVRMATELRQAKKPVPSRNKLFDMAIEALHKKENKKVDAKTADKLKDRTSKALGQGSGKASAETTAQEALRVQKDFDSKIDKE